MGHFKINYLGCIYVQQLTYRICFVCSPRCLLILQTTPFPDSSDLVSEVYLDVETMPLAFFSFISVLSWQQYLPNNQGFSYNLNVDDTPTYISNQYFSPILVLHFLLLAGYLMESQTNMSTDESFYPDSTRVLLSPFSTSEIVSGPQLRCL